MRWVLGERRARARAQTAAVMSFVRRAAIAGAGIALLPELVGVRAVRGGHLEAVLSAYHVTGMPLYLVYPSPLHDPHRVRALREHLLAHFPQ